MGNMVSKCNDLVIYGGVVCALSGIVVGAAAYGGAPAWAGALAAVAFVGGAIAVLVGNTGKGRSCE